MTGQADHYRELYDESPTGQFTVDDSGRVAEANRTLLTWLGLERDELVGRPFASLLSTADQLFYETRVSSVLRLSGEAREVSFSLLGATETVPVLLNARLAQTDGRPDEIRISVFDVTQRHDYERQLLGARREPERSEARVRTLQLASTAFGASNDESELADHLVAMTREAMAAPECAVLLVDDQGTPTTVAGRHPLQALAADPAVADEVAALRTAGVLAFGDLDELTSRFPLVARRFAAARIEAFSVVPLVGEGMPPTADGIALGALMCFFRRPRTMTPDDLELQLALARQAAQSLTRLRLQQKLLELAQHDQLTGLANRRLLQELLGRGMATAAAEGRPIAIIVLDLDGFKAVNDELGHQAGDNLLTRVAEQIQNAVRADDVVGRFGGDEFVIICHDADAAAADQVAERVRAAIATQPTGLPEGATLGASFGIAVCRVGEASIEPEDFFAAADAALYRSKREGKDRITVATL